jgi:hypothetical protein
MGAPPLPSPNTSYHKSPPPPYSTIHTTAPPSAHSISGLISPTQSSAPDSRRMSDSKEPSGAPCQSLTSIQEAFYPQPPTSYPPPRLALNTSTRPYTTIPQQQPTPKVVGTASIRAHLRRILRQLHPRSALHLTQYTLHHIRVRNH